MLCARYESSRALAAPPVAWIGHCRERVIPWQLYAVPGKVLCAVLPARSDSVKEVWMAGRALAALPDAGLIRLAHVDAPERTAGRIRSRAGGRQ